eukprot:2182565-Pyramimonas_sp.AAC.1
MVRLPRRRGETPKRPRLARLPRHRDETPKRLRGGRCARRRAWLDERRNATDNGDRASRVITKHRGNAGRRNRGRATALHQTAHVADGPFHLVGIV